MSANPSNESTSSNRAAIRQIDGIPRFQPHPWCRGGWLQTISIKWLRPHLSLETRPDAVTLTVSDADSPPDELQGIYFPAVRDTGPKPLVVVYHGMGGHALSHYMRSMAERLNSEGYPALLWNHRGAGSSRESCSQLHHPGRTDDVRCLINHLVREQPLWMENGLCCVAFSLGANLLLKYLAETRGDAGFRAAVSISAPLDMKITSRNLRRGANRVFDRYLLIRQREELLREGAKISEEERELLNRVASVWDLDDRFTGPRLGYDGAESFYRGNSAIHFLDQICRPTLMLHAEDDPVVDPAVFYGVDWDSSEALFPAITPAGGHTGFLSSDGNRWHEQATIAFLDRHS